MIRKNDDTVNFDTMPITNDLMFGAVFQDEENCKELLQRILGIQIRELTVIEGQKTIQNTINAKGIRIDIFAKDMDGNSYDIEMQKIKSRDLELRSRYYHSEMDGFQINKGCKYKALKESVVIFICDFDLFQKGKSIYTFETICMEDKNIQLHDKRHTIFVNINGERNEITKELKDLLNFFKDGDVNDEYTEKLANDVTHFRKSGEWRSNYMTLEMKIEQECEIAHEAGRAEGLREGVSEGKLLSILELLADLGPVSDEMKDQLKTISDKEQLSLLLKKASKAESIPQFQEELRTLLHA